MVAAAAAALRPNRVIFLAGEGRWKATNKLVMKNKGEKENGVFVLIQERVKSL